MNRASGRKKKRVRVTLSELAASTCERQALMSFLQKLKAQLSPKVAAVLVASAVLGTTGGVAIASSLSDDCCVPGAACCHPGAACCNAHKAAH